MDALLSDRKRIIASTPFRRLQTKAQVFSLEHNAAVRSRLTHTLEVASYGSMLATTVFGLLRKHRIVQDQDLAEPFRLCVECGCLLHDIGNPPFGHLGEHAIRAWFKTNQKDIKLFWERNSSAAGSQATPPFHSFESFDGNSQAVRILLRLQWLGDKFSINLTNSVTASILKYLGTHEDNNRDYCKKAGFFESDREDIVTIWRSLQLTVRDGYPAQRHPLVYLIEAADDISYRLSDIEDAIEKRLLTEAEFLGLLPKSIKRISKDGFEGVGKLLSSQYLPRDAKFIVFRINAIEYLIRVAAEAFVKHNEAIFSGTFSDKRTLFSDDPLATDLMLHLERVCRERVFASKEAVQVELNGFHVITALLDAFRPLLSHEKKLFQSMLPGALDPPEYGAVPLERRLIHLLAEKHIIAYRHACDVEPWNEPVWRTHLIVDNVSGMTDSHAVKVYHMLFGVRIEGVI